MADTFIPVTDAIDPDEVIFGENGEIESMTDPETGEVIKADPKPEPVRGPRGPSDLDPDNNGRSEDDEPTGPRQDANKEKPGTQTALSTTERDFLTDTLAVYGLETDEIEWNGEQVRVSELEPDERREFLAELRDRDRAEAANVNEAELELLDFVRSGGDLREAFGGGKTAGESSTVAGLDADGLNRLDIRQQYPDLTDEEVESELEDRKAGKLYDKKTGSLKDRLVSAEQATQKAARDTEFAQEQQQFVTAANSLKEVFGFPISDEIRQMLFQQTAVSVDEAGNSAFIKGLTPDKILKLQYLDSFGEQMKQYYEKQVTDSYKKGRNDALEGAPSRPSGRSGSAGSTNRGQGATAYGQRDTSRDSDFTLGAN